jgi:hypothetical protein
MYTKAPEILSGGGGPNLSLPVFGGGRQNLS